MDIRLAEPQEWDKVISAAAEIFEREQKIPKELNPIPDSLSPRWWCAEEDGMILGTLAAYFTEGQCHVGRLTVAPAFRGRGIAGKILQYALGELFSQGITEVHADARDPAVRLLCRMGGQVTGASVPFYVGNVTPVLVKKENFQPIDLEYAALEKIRREMETIPGHLGLYYKNLSTGFEYGVQEEDAFLAASVIKLPLLLHILFKCARGELSLDQKVQVTEEEKMPSCGALTLLTGTVETDIRSLCRLMIAISDNTATNKLINLCGIEDINRGFRDMGLEKTVLRRLLFDSEASKRGLENTICPREMGMLLEKLYRKEMPFQEGIFTEAMDMLLHQQIGHKLDGRLCGAVPIAHKTGEDEALSNDVGIIFAKEPFILCFAGHDTEVYPWEDLIRRAAYDLTLVQGK